MRRRNWLLYLTKEFKKKEKKTSSLIRYWSGGKGIRADEWGLRQSLEAHNLLPLRFNSKDWNLCYILEEKKRPFNLWCPRLCMLIVTNIINRSIRNIQLLTNQPWKCTTIFVLSFQIRVIFFHPLEISFPRRFTKALWSELWCQLSASTLSLTVNRTIDQIIWNYKG